MLQAQGLRRQHSALRSLWWKQGSHIEPSHSLFFPPPWNLWEIMWIRRSLNSNHHKQAFGLERSLTGKYCAAFQTELDCVLLGTAQQTWSQTIRKVEREREHSLQHISQLLWKANFISCFLEVLKAFYFFLKTTLSSPFRQRLASLSSFCTLKGTK